MPSTALMFGSIGVLAETSDLQRKAFNTAFEVCGLPWHWHEEVYTSLLEVPGGRARIRYYGLARGSEVDVDGIYEAKLAAFGALLEAGVELRPGVLELIEAAQARNIKLGFVSATDPQQVDMILDALRPRIDPALFDFVGNRSFAPLPKPAPDIYLAALYALGVQPENAVAVEDTPESATAALAAGVRTFAYPGRAAAHRAFPSNVTRVAQLDRALLPKRVVAA